VKVCVCNNDEQKEKALWDDIAFIFQKPNNRLKHAIVLLGDEGTGKNTLTDLLCDLCGEDYSQRNINNINEIIGDVGTRSLLSYRKIVVGNELRSNEHGKLDSDGMKSRITEDFYNVRDLFENPLNVRNVNSYFLLSNNFDCLKIGENDRRYFILRMNEEHRQDKAYFNTLYKSFTKEMKEHLFNWLLRRDLSNYEQNTVLETEEKQELKEIGACNGIDFIKEFNWGVCDIEDMDTGISADKLWSSYCCWFKEKELNQKYKCASIKSLGVKIKDYVITKSGRDKNKEGKPKTTFYFPNWNKLEKPEDQEAAEESI
jgi:hypothetical protein